METFAMQLLDPAGYYRNFVNNKVRIDGRGFSDLRQIVISGGDFNARPSCGSSLIRWGETTVACGVTIQIGTPSQQSPDSGDIDFNVCLWPSCSPKFDQRGKPDEALQVEYLLNDLINKGKLLDLTQLGIERGRYAFRLSISVVCLSYGGNFVDAAVLSVVKALMDFKLPRAIVGESVTLSTVENEKKSLVLSRTPVSITCAIFDDVLLVDPLLQEEEVARGFVTCVLDESNNICTMKQEITAGAGFTVEQLKKVIELSAMKAEEIRASGL